MRDAVEDARLHGLLSQLPTPRYVVDLGCGAAQDVHVYRAVWPSACIVGLDHARIATVGRRAASGQRARRDGPFHLVIGDAAQPPLAPWFEAILVRHPDLDRLPESWARALHGAAHLLRAGGALLVTTYSLAEVERIARWLDSDPLLCPLALDRATLGPAGLSGRDRHALAYTRC